jgi:hypothetical protein
VKRRQSYLVLVMLLAVGVLPNCRGPRPRPSGYDSAAIDTAADPVQEDLTPEQGEAEKLVEHVDDATLVILPLARYRVAAEVKSVERYSRGWQGEFAPVDLALAWGALNTPAADRAISYSQSRRWYNYRYQADIPFPAGYISTHSANTHIVPATQNLRRALAWVKRGDRLILEGELIRVNGTTSDGTFYWNSSTSRLDTGDGSCEVLYLRRLVQDHKVYR